MDERQAAEALATVRAQQERTRRMARLPWWTYAAMFVLVAGGTAANDFVGLGGAKLIAALVLVVLAVVLVTTFAGGASLLSRVRGVQRRQPFVPSVFVVLVVVGALGAWLIPRYGPGLTGDIADAVGLRDYPDTVAGVLYGAAFTVLFALVQLATAASWRRADQ